MVTWGKLEEKIADMNGIPLYSLWWKLNYLPYNILWPKIIRQYGINEKSGKELGNNYCLHESFSTTYARKSLNFNMISFSKGKMYTWRSNCQSIAISIYLYVSLSQMLLSWLSECLKNCRNQKSREKNTFLTWNQFICLFIFSWLK